VNILDENISENQAALLASWRIRFKQIGSDVGRSGMTDEAIIPLLLRQALPTFFTRDKGFYDFRLCHARYCLVFLDVRRNETASFNSKRKRMGKVVRASRGKIVFCDIVERRSEKELRWFAIA
jgi:magnesium-transporting ATPase (P-type)